MEKAAGVILDAASVCFGLRFNSAPLKGYFFSLKNVKEERQNFRLSAVKHGLLIKRRPSGTIGKPESLVGRGGKQMNGEIAGFFR